MESRMAHHKFCVATLVAALPYQRIKDQSSLTESECGSEGDLMQNAFTRLDANLHLRVEMKHGHPRYTDEGLGRTCINAPLTVNAEPSQTIQSQVCWVRSTAPTCVRSASARTRISARSRPCGSARLVGASRGT